MRRVERAISNSQSDPLRLKTRGPKTMATSSNVDHTQPPGSTKTVDRFQTEELGRRKAPLRRTKRRHRCPVCLLEGHHARTCRSILSDENTERSLAYFKKLLAKDTFKAFIVSFSARESVQSAIRVVTLLRDAGFLAEPEARALLTCIERR